MPTPMITVYREDAQGDRILIPSESAPDPDGSGVGYVASSPTGAFSSAVLLCSPSFPRLLSSLPRPGRASRDARCEEVARKPAPGAAAPPGSAATAPLCIPPAKPVARSHLPRPANNGRDDADRSPVSRPRKDGSETRPALPPQYQKYPGPPRGASCQPGHGHRSARLLFQKPRKLAPGNWSGHNQQRNGTMPATTI